MNQYEENIFSFISLDQNDYFESFRRDEYSKYRYGFNSNSEFEDKDQQEQQNPCLKTEITNLNTFQYKSNLQKACFQGRANTQIQFSSEARFKMQKVVQGTKDDTVNLNVNFKTILVKILKEILVLNELSADQAQQVEDFISRPPSFKSLYLLCRGGSGQSSIRDKLRSVIESKVIITKIMSNRGRLEMKMEMIKFLEILRRNVVQQKGIIKWKQLLKK